MTTVRPAAPISPSTSIERSTAIASSRDAGTTVPLPTARPSAFTTTSHGRDST